MIASAKCGGLGAVMLWVLICGCSDSKVRSQGGSGDLTLHNKLLSAGDVIEASSAIEVVPIRGCAALGNALTALDSRAPNQAFDPQSYRGLVEELLKAARANCPAPKAQAALRSKVARPAARLALSLLASDDEQALSALVDADDNSALLQRSSELLFKLERHQEGLDALLRRLKLDDEPEQRAIAVRLLLLAGEPQRALALCRAGETAALVALRVGALAALARYDELADAIREAPLHWQSELAESAARFAKDPLAMTLAEDTPAPLLVAVAQHQDAVDKDAALQRMSRAAARLPRDADVHIALAEMLEARGQGEEAIAAWDRAAEILPSAERPTLRPIRLLSEHGRKKEALSRAARMRGMARLSKVAEDWRMASLAYKYAGDVDEAVALAALAVRSRPTDGRLISEHAARLQDARRDTQAAQLLANLLVCGAHGRPWHRHELMARLAELVDNKTLHEMIATLSCAVVEPEDLASHLSAGTSGADQHH